MTFELDGLRRCYDIHRVGDVVYVDSALGSSELIEQPRFPSAQLHASVGSLRSPLPGSVVAVHVEVGAVVTAGDVLVALEAMKMEHSIRAPHDGVVSEVRVKVGDQVETGAVLIVVDDAREDK